MNFVSVTRLRLRHWRHLPAFAWRTFWSWLQARRAPGQLHTRVCKDAGLVFWTFTVWRAEAAMRHYRNHGAHQAAMAKLAEWCDEATYVHWLQPGDEAPDPAESAARLIRDGVASRVNHPSPHHATRNFAPPVFRL